MWTVFVNLRTLSDPTVSVKTPVGLPVSNYLIWSPAAIALDGYSLEATNALIIDFKLVHARGSILIRSLSVPVGRLSYDEQVTRILDFPEEKVSLSYMAFKYEEGENLHLGQVHISVISIKYDIEQLLRPADGDRIAIQCGDYQVERCQRICIADDATTFLTWTSGPSPHRLQYPIHLIDESIDSPDYSNPHHMLPKYVAMEQQFALLNYRFTPPTVVPFIVRFDGPMLIQPDTVDGKQSIIRRKMRYTPGKRFQVYSLKKVLAEGSIVVTFFYIFIRSLVQIQLIEMKWQK